jgi:hypothetical protein
MSDALLYSKILLNCPSHEKPPLLSGQMSDLFSLDKFYCRIIVISDKNLILFVSNIHIVYLFLRYPEGSRSTTSP